MRAAAIIAGVLLPPLGVYLSEGVTRNFWIAAGLTLIAFVPGLIYAELVVLRPDLFVPRTRPNPSPPA